MACMAEYDHDTSQNDVVSSGGFLGFSTGNVVKASIVEMTVALYGIEQCGHCYFQGFVWMD